MKLAITLSALATLALTLLPGSTEATFVRRPSCKEKNGSCRTLLGRQGFNFKIGPSTLCIPEAWRCGQNGVTCNNKPKVDYCPQGYECPAPHLSLF